MSGTLQTVHVRVNDAATGKPTPVRIRITDANGPYYPPLGRLGEFATGFAEDVGGNVLVGGEAYAYIDGTCEIPLPPGRLTVAIEKGPEYRPIREEVNLPAGKLALRFVIERWADLRAEGWYSGDSHCYFLTPHAALLEAAAEDLAVVNLLAWECFLHNADSGHTYRAIPNLLAFSGQEPALQAPGHLVAVNTLNVHEKLGSLFLLNCHRVIYPLRCGDSEVLDAWRVAEGFDTWRLADWCDQCHRKGGLVIGEGFFGNSPDHPHGELLADLILGKVDVLEIGDFESAAEDRERGKESPLREWYQLLDCGFRVPLVGGSGKDNNLRPLGGVRTYARLGTGQPFTYKNWVEAVRAGRTFVTSGPLLNFTVNEQPPGAVLDVPAGTSVRVRAEARSLRPLDRLEIFANHRVVAAVDGAGTPAHALIEAEVPLPEGGWLVAHCWGAYDDAIEDWHAAQSSPVYVQVEGRRPPAEAAAVAAFAGKLEKMLRWVADEARCEDEPQRQRLAAVFQQAHAVHLARR